ncbi:MAG: hypothetical protein ABJG75_10165 [Roseobacter sp.]
MSFQDCLLLAWFDVSLAVVMSAGVAISFLFWRAGKAAFAIGCFFIAVLAASAWAYFFFEMNCVELRNF